MILMTERIKYYPFVLLKRLVLCFFVLLFVFNWWNGILPHQLANAPLFDVSLDNTFWLFHLTGIPNFLIHQPVLLIILEALLIVLAIIAFRINNRIVNISFLLLAIFVSLLTQTYSSTLTKTSVIFPIVFLPFCLNRNWFSTTWKIPRYYLVYLMVSAGIYKLWFGGALHSHQMEHILWNQHIDLLFYNSNHIAGRIKDVLLAQPSLASVLYWITIIVECSFITLIFTNRFDKFFGIVLVLFCLGIYLTFRIYTLDMLVLTLPILSFYKRNS